MHTHGNYRSGDLRPAMVIALIAIASITGILLDDFGPDNASHDDATARMITTAAVSRAGAVETPSELSSTRRPPV